jgi:hypothetical protein
MILDGRMFYFTSATTIRKLLEVLLKEIKYTRKEERGYRMKK